MPPLKQWTNMPPDRLIMVPMWELRRTAPLLTEAA